jgi:hypothetical protein
MRAGVVKIVIFGILTSGAARSQGLTPHHTALAQNCLGRHGVGPTFCDVADNSQKVSKGLTSVSGSYGSSGIDATLTGSASAEAGFGVLRAKSSAQFHIGGAPGHAFGNAGARFWDVITVNFAPLTGKQGILLVEYVLRGNSFNTGAGKALADVSIGVGPPNKAWNQLWKTSHSGPVSGLFPAPKKFTFIYGEPFGITLLLSAEAGTVLSAGTICIFCSGSGGGTADYAWVLAGFQSYDSQMNLVAGATITSGSGTPYTSNGVGLPVSILIQPGENPTGVNPQSIGRIPLAILSSATFDALSVDSSSLSFRRLGDEHSLALCNSGGEDVNGDGLRDLVCQFNTRETEFKTGDTTGILRGSTASGVPIQGRGSLRLVH